MGISMRQHLASLVAVFLALFIGVLVGVGLARRPGLEKQIGKLTHAVQQRRDQETDRNDVAREFSAALAPMLVGGKLAGQKAAVFVTATSLADTASGAAKDALELAGAEVVVLTDFDAHFVRNCEEDRESLVAELRLTVHANEHVADVLVTRIVRAAIGGDGDDRALQRGGLFRVASLADGAPALAVVVGGSDVPQPDRLEHLDLPLIRALKSSRSIERIVGCEACDVFEPVMRAYQKEDISTVDHVDTAPGQFSLVLALAGVDGHYGVKRGASLPFPEISEQP